MSRWAIQRRGGKGVAVAQTGVGLQSLAAGADGRTRPLAGCPAPAQSVAWISQRRSTYPGRATRASSGQLPLPLQATAFSV